MDLTNSRRKNLPQLLDQSKHKYISLKSVRFSKDFAGKLARTRGFLWCSIIVDLQNFCTCKSWSMNAMNDISLISVYHDKFNLKICSFKEKIREVINQCHKNPKPHFRLFYGGVLLSMWVDVIGIIITPSIILTK